MSFNRRLLFEFCKPNCPDRKPACQDHCQYNKDRHAEYERLKAIQDADREIRYYTGERHAKISEQVIRKQKRFGGSYWRGGRDR